MQGCRLFRSGRLVPGGTAQGCRLSRPGRLVPDGTAQGCRLSRPDGSSQLGRRRLPTVPARTAHPNWDGAGLPTVPARTAPDARSCSDSASPLNMNLPPSRRQQQWYPLAVVGSPQRDDRRRLGMPGRCWLSPPTRLVFPWWLAALR